jgi:hypothetical protein
VTGLAIGPHHVFATSRLGVAKIPRPGSGNTIYCDGFDGEQRVRQLDARCSGRLRSPSP